jgi:hypothetical protein
MTLFVTLRHIDRHHAANARAHRPERAASLHMARQSPRKAVVTSANELVHNEFDRGEATLLQDGLQACPGPQPAIGNPSQSAIHQGA